MLFNDYQKIGVMAENFLIGVLKIFIGSFLKCCWTSVSNRTRSMLVPFCARRLASEDNNLFANKTFF